MSWEEELSRSVNETFTPGLRNHYKRLVADNAYHTCEECGFAIGKYPGKYGRYCPHCGTDFYYQSSFPKRPKIIDSASESIMGDPARTPMTPVGSPATPAAPAVEAEDEDEVTESTILPDPELVEIVDTRDYDWVSGKPIPGSGKPNFCFRCSKTHEVHWIIRDARGKMWTVGAGCAKLLWAGWQPSPAELKKKEAESITKLKQRTFERRSDAVADAVRKIEDQLPTSFPGYRTESFDFRGKIYTSNDNLIVVTLRDMAMAAKPADFVRVLLKKWVKVQSLKLLKAAKPKLTADEIEKAQKRYADVVVLKLVSTTKVTESSSVAEKLEPLPADECDPLELEAGIAVEMEHTDDKAEASRIARQHLQEDPHYYRKLFKAEILKKDEVGDDVWAKMKDVWTEAMGFGSGCWLTKSGVVIPVSNHGMTLADPGARKKMGLSNPAPGYGDFKAAYAAGNLAIRRYGAGDLKVDGRFTADAIARVKKAVGDLAPKQEVVWGDENGELVLAHISGSLFASVFTPSDVKEVKESGKAVCAWCGKDLGERPELKDGEVTHGICAPCRDKMLTEGVLETLGGEGGPDAGTTEPPPGNVSSPQMGGRANPQPKEAASVDGQSVTPGEPPTGNPQGSRAVESELEEWGQQKGTCSNCGKSVPKSDMRGSMCRACANDVARPDSIPASSQDAPRGKTSESTEHKYATPKLIGIEDTRDIDFESGKRIPGTGEAATCQRCNRKHEVIYHVQDRDGKMWFVGSGCCKQFFDGWEPSKDELRIARQKAREAVDARIAARGETLAAEWRDEMRKQLASVRKPEVSCLGASKYAHGPEDRDYATSDGVITSHMMRGGSGHFTDLPSSTQKQFWGLWAYTLVRKLWDRLGYGQKIPKKVGQGYFEKEVVEALIQETLKRLNLPVTESSLVEFMVKLPTDVDWYSPDGGHSKIWLKSSSGVVFFWLRNGRWTRQDFTSQETVPGQQITASHPKVREIVHKFFALDEASDSWEDELTTEMMGYPVIDEIEQLGESVEVVTLGPDLIKRLKEEYQMLMRNAGARVKTLNDAEEFLEGVMTWVEYLRKLCIGSGHSNNNSPIRLWAYKHSLLTKYYSEKMDAEISDIDRAVKAAFSDLELALEDVPSTFRLRQREGKSPEECLQWLKDQLENWKRRSASRAVKFWDVLDYAIVWLKRTALNAEENPALPVSRSTKTTIEGWQVQIEGEVEKMETLKHILKTARSRLASVYPQVLRIAPPLHLLSADLGTGGLYYGNKIVLNIHTFISSTSPMEGVHVLIHELGHHVYRTLSADVKKMWDTAVRSDKATVHLSRLFADMKDDEDVLDYLKRLHSSGRYVDYLHLETLLYLPGSVGFHEKIHTHAEVRAAIAKHGDTISLPAHPVTYYASKNTEEAFCEAFGLRIAYGPRTLHPMILALLKTALPSMRTESKETVDGEDGGRAFKSAVGIVIKDRSDVLFGLAVTTDDRNDKWCFPGGGVDPEDGGDVLISARREVFEETSLDVRPSGTVLVHPDQPEVAFVVCEFIAGTLHPNREFSELQWIPFGAVDQFPDVYSMNKSILQRVPNSQLGE